ncbi:SLC37A1_2 [Acanthosepion pharaonis]|uniref:SLC37A1_2 n=1 Tax=Acanthosepion pharaonis TaxID=158019 RepID=A0A812BW96_ACAPH|nr:SLC37A1_2 [Sepia pharaonis]
MALREESEGRSPPLGIKLLPTLENINRNLVYKIYIVIFTFLCYTSYHLSRKPISVVKSVLHHNCSILPNGTFDPSLINSTICDWKPFDGTNAQELLGSLDYAFLFSYAISMFISGHVAERMNLRYFLSGGMLLSGIFTAAFGLGKIFNIHNIIFYILIQIISGVFQATGWPSVVTCMGNWHGKGNRGLIMGFWNSHTSVGNILGSVVAGEFVDSNWGLSFIVPGLIIFILGIFVFFFLVPNPEDVGCSLPDQEPENSVNKIPPTENEPLLGSGQSSEESGNQENKKAISFWGALKIPVSTLFFFFLLLFPLLFFLSFFLFSPPLFPFLSFSLFSLFPFSLFFPFLSFSLFSLFSFSLFFLFLSFFFFSLLSLLLSLSLFFCFFSFSFFSLFSLFFFFFLSLFFLFSLFSFSFLSFLSLFSLFFLFCLSLLSLFLFFFLLFLFSSFFFLFFSFFSSFSLFLSFLSLSFSPFFFSFLFFLVFFSFLFSFLSFMIRYSLSNGVVEFSLCLFFAKLISYTFLFWLPNYINHETNYNAEKSAYLSTLFDFGGILGGIFAGFVSDKLNSRGAICMFMLALAAPMLYFYNMYGSESFVKNVLLLIICGAFVNGPYSLITTAVSADLGTHSSLNGDARALATVTAIIDGTGSMGAAVGPFLTGVISEKYSWNSVFFMLIAADILAFLVSTFITYQRNELSPLLRYIHYNTHKFTSGRAMQAVWFFLMLLIMYFIVHCNYMVSPWR